MRWARSHVRSSSRSLSREGGAEARKTPGRGVIARNFFRTSATSNASSLIRSRNSLESEVYSSGCLSLLQKVYPRTLREGGGSGGSLYTGKRRVEKSSGPRACWSAVQCWE